VTWLDNFSELLCDADAVYRRWFKVRSEVPFGDRAALAEAWRLATGGEELTGPDASLSAAREVMRDIEFAVGVARPFVQQVIASVNGGLQRLERPVVLPSDFGGKVLFVCRNGMEFALGEASALPQDHPLLAAVPEESRYLQDGKQCFVLGDNVMPYDGGRYAADYYEFAAVVKFTNDWSSRQRAALNAHITATAASVAAAEARRLSR
jgi:hypothetical protein